VQNVLVGECHPHVLGRYEIADGADHRRHV
jgi:hypothetical protein